MEFLTEKEIAEAEALCEEISAVAGNDGMSKIDAALYLIPRALRDLPCALAEIRRLRCEVSHFEAENERLRDYILPDAECPCCESVRECSSDCTFVFDFPDQAERMKYVRAMLYGGILEEASGGLGDNCKEGKG